MAFPRSWRSQDLLVALFVLGVYAGMTMGQPYTRQQCVSMGFSNAGVGTFSSTCPCGQLWFTIRTSGPSCTRLTTDGCADFSWDRLYASCSAGRHPNCKYSFTTVIPLPDENHRTANLSEEGWSFFPVQIWAGVFFGDAKTHRICICKYIFSASHQPPPRHKSLETHTRRAWASLFSSPKW
jgi:hypothetical protein